jgi:GNAT superfamily N-acetyltransferase
MTLVSDGNRLIGALRRRTYVEGWYVADGWRRQGVGRALMQAAEQWARDAGFAGLGSDARVENEVSLLAHERLGFAPTERLQFFRRQLGPANPAEAARRRSMRR